MLITIDTYINYLEAHIVKGRLEVEGINTFIIHDSHISVDWWIALALGYIKIQVHPSNIKEGKEVLKQIEEGKFSALLDDSSSEEKIACPSCNNKHIIFDYFSRNIALAFLFFSIPVPYSNATVKCLDCGHIWRERTTIAYNGFFLFIISFITITILHPLGSVFIYLVNWFDARNIFIF